MSFRIKLTERERYMVLRKRKRISLRVIARELECDLSLLSKWENGTFTPKAPRSQQLIRDYKEYIERQN